MIKYCLLIGKNHFVIEAIREQLYRDGIELLVESNLSGVKNAMSDKDIDTVIIGQGIDPEVQGEIIKYVSETSPSTNIHMKDWTASEEGLVAFIQGIVSTLA